MVLDPAHTVDWAEQLPPDVESIATSDEVKLYADAYPQLVESNVDSVDSLNGVSDLFDMNDAVIEQVAEYGYGDFFADFDTAHRTPLHMVYRLSDEEAAELFGELEENTSVSYDTVDDMFKQGVQHLVREFEHTPFSLDDELVDELTADEANLLILQCNRAVEIAELGLLSHKQAQCYLLQHHGLKNKHIADLLDMEPGTVASHIGRAKEKIKTQTEAVDVVEDAVEHTTAVIDALEDRIGEVYYHEKEDTYYQVKFGGQFDGGMIGYVLQDPDGNDNVNLDHGLMSFDHVPEDEVPEDVTFPEDPIHP